MSITPRLRVLLFAQAAFMLGFSSVIPFIAVIGQQRFTFDAAAIGAVVGLRVVMQQGFFVVGGALADRVGPRVLLLVGTGVRAIGFAVIASAADPVVFVVGVASAGFAGALFSPALDTYVGEIDHRRRMHADRARPGPTPFAAVAMAGEVGGIGGAIAGSLLMPSHSALVSWAASGVFVLAFFFLAVALPARAAPSHAPARAATTHAPGRAPLPSAERALGAASLIAAAAPLLAVYTVLFTLIPLQLTAEAMPMGLAGIVPLTLSIATLALQWPLSWLSERVGRVRAVAGALVLSAGAALVAALTSALTEPAVVTASIVLITVLTGSALMLGTPSAQSLLAQMGRTERRATRLGALATAGGVLSLVVSTSAGLLTEAVGIGFAWAATAAVPVCGLAVLLTTMRSANRSATLTKGRS